MAAQPVANHYIYCTIPVTTSVLTGCTGSGKKTSRIWRGRCVSCGGDTAAEGVSIDSGIRAIWSSRNDVAR
jgi:hypothetical protein